MAEQKFLELLPHPRNCGISEGWTGTCRLRRVRGSRNVLFTTEQECTVSFCKVLRYSVQKYKTLMINMAHMGSDGGAESVADGQRLGWVESRSSEGPGVLGRLATHCVLRTLSPMGCMAVGLWS